MVKDLSKYCGRRIGLIIEGEEYFGQVVKIGKEIKSIFSDLNMKNSLEEYYFIKEFPANLREPGTIIPLYAKGKERVRGTGRPNQLIASQKSLDNRFDPNEEIMLASATIHLDSSKVELDTEGLEFLDKPLK